MDIKQMTLQDLESCFNLVSKIREGVIMMARANNNLNNKDMRDINNKYNMLLNEVMSRLNSLYEGKINSKELLNEEVVH